MHVRDRLETLAIALLNDEHGINEQAYSQLVSLMQETYPDGYTELLDKVRHTDGRFYVKQEDVQHIIDLMARTS